MDPGQLPAVNPGQPPAGPGYLPAAPAGPPALAGAADALPFDPGHLSDPWKRFGGFLLDTLLVLVTLFIGWIVWAIVLLWKGQTPAMQILGMRTVNAKTGRQASVGEMLLRNLLIQGAISLLPSFLFPGLGYLALLGAGIPMWANPKRQTVWDMGASTTIVDDPQGYFAQR